MPLQKHAEPNGSYRGILSRCVLGLVFASSVPFLAQAQRSYDRDNYDARVTCASDNRLRNYCSADTRGGVLLSRQLSRSACRQGTSWGYDRRGIWVDRGCSAEFTVKPYAYAGREYEKVVPEGTGVGIRTNQMIDARNNDGRIYSGNVATNVYDEDGRIAVPAGSPAELIVRSYPNGDLLLDLESVTINGLRYSVSTDPTQITAARRGGLGPNERTAEFVGGGALLGTIIGAIAGGGKGAAIGAAAGAGAGAGGQLLTRGRRVWVPAESIVTFYLNQPLSVGIADNGYNRGRDHYHYPDTIFPDPRTN